MEESHCNHAMALHLRLLNSITVSVLLGQWSSVVITHNAGLIQSAYGLGWQGATQSRAVMGYSLHDNKHHINVVLRN